MSSEFNPDFENLLQDEFNSEFNSFDALYHDIIDNGTTETAPWSDQLLLTQVPSSGAIGNIQQEPDQVSPDFHIEGHHAFPSSTDFSVNVESNTNNRPLQQGLGVSQLQSQADSRNPTEPPQLGEPIVRDSLRNSTMSWIGPQKCDHLGCQSKETFRTRSAFKRHLENIHLNPLLCKVAGCRHGRPFSRPRDLERHIDTAHKGTRPYKCPETSCNAHADGFRRKDHLQLHMRTKHPNLRCMLNHCHDTVVDTEQDNHLQQGHGPFECEIGGCVGGSRFLHPNLGRHLRVHHGFSYDSALQIMIELEMSQMLTVTSCHLTRILRLKACKWCSAQAETAEDRPSIDPVD